MLSVEATFDNSQREFAFFPTDQVVLKKSLEKDGSVRTEINSKDFPFKEYLLQLEIAGFKILDPLNFVMQGRIKQISQLSGSALYDLFCNIVGTASYHKCKDESVAMVKSTVSDEQKVLDLLEEFRERLDELEYDKEDFKKFEQSIKSVNR